MCDFMMLNLWMFAWLAVLLAQSLANSYTQLIAGKITTAASVAYFPTDFAARLKNSYKRI